MNFKHFTSDVRVRLFVVVAVVASLLAARKVRVLDAINGPVDKVLADFARLDARLDRARMASVRQANRLDAKAKALEAQLDAIDDAYAARIEAAERAARVQKRVSALLD